MATKAATKSSASPSTLTILSWNVNGLRSILGKGFARVINELRPDAVCLQEVKAFEKDVPHLAVELPDYQTFYSSAQKPGYSGVATLLRSPGLIPPEAILRNFSPTAVRFAREGRILILPLGEFSIYNLYFPSGTSGERRQAEKYIFLDLFLNHLKQLNPKEKNKVIVCGDLNICHRPIDIHHPIEAERRKLTGFLPEERVWMDAFVAAGFTDTYRALHPERKGEYSWWTYRAGARGKNLGWRIDYQFVADALAKRVTDARLLTSIEGSDHCPTVLSIDL